MVYLIILMIRQNFKPQKKHIVHIFIANKQYLFKQHTFPNTSISPIVKFLMKIISIVIQTEICLLHSVAS